MSDTNGCARCVGTEDVAIAIGECIASLDANHEDALPNVADANVLFMGTDIGGSHKGSQFEVMTLVLVANDECFKEWQKVYSDVRASYLKDGRNLSFKGLNDHQKRLALIPFLQAADGLNGIVLSLLIDKAARSVFRPGCRDELSQEVQGILLKWKPATVERLLRLVHLTGIASAVFGGPEQSVLWFSDADEVFANRQRTRDACRVADEIFSGYQPVVGPVMIVTTDERSTPIESLGLVSIADLVAGALAEWTPGAIERGFFDKAEPIQAFQTIKPKADVLLGWYANNSAMLKRFAIVVQAMSPTRFKVFGVRFH